MRNEDAAATEAALDRIRRIANLRVRQDAARELELHYSRAVLTLRAVQDDAARQRRGRREMDEAVGKLSSDKFGE